MFDKDPSWDRNRSSKTAFDPKRTAYLQNRCVANGVNPFHNARVPSSCATVFKQCRMPDTQFIDFRILSINVTFVLG